MIRNGLQLAARRDTWLARWDPRWKLGAFLVLAATLAVERPGMRQAPDAARDLPPAFAAVAVSVLLVRAARIPLGAAARRLRGVAVLLVLLLVVFPLTWKGGERVEVGPLHLSVGGFLVASLIVLRSIAILLLVFPAFSTTRFDRTLRALRSFHLPGPLILIGQFAYRYAFVYAEQSRRARLALRARGFTPRPNLRTIRTLADSLGMLLVTSVDRVQRISRAMRSRGSSGAFPALDAGPARPADLAAFVAVTGLGLLLLAWRLS